MKDPKNTLLYMLFTVFVGPMLVLALYLLNFFVFVRYAGNEEAALTFSQLFIVSFVLICAWDFVFVFFISNKIR